MHRKAPDEVPTSPAETMALWRPDIVEVTGLNLEARSQEDAIRLVWVG